MLKSNRQGKILVDWLDRSNRHRYTGQTQDGQRNDKGLNVWMGIGMTKDRMCVRGSPTEIEKLNCSNTTGLPLFVVAPYP